MTWLTQAIVELRVRAASLFARQALRRRVDEEMAFHREMRIARLLDSGLTLDQARVQARKEFGNPLVIREAALDMWRYGTMERLLQDLQYAVRMLVRSPGFTAAAVLSLSLGIGANAAIFSLIDRVMLRLLPVPDSETLVVVQGTHSYPRYEYFRDRAGDLFDGVLGFAALSQITVDGAEDAAGTAEGRLVTGNYFAVLGVQALMGRTITPDDDRVPGGHPVVVISHAFWQRYFNGDPGVLGRTVRLGPGRLSSGMGTGGFDAQTESARPVQGERFEIIGVAPRGFVGETIGQHPDFWAPVQMQEHFMPGRPWLRRHTASWVRLMARLRPSVSRDEAQARLTSIYRQSLFDQRGATATPQQREQFARATVQLLDGDKGFSPLRGQFSAPLVVLMVMVGVVLLIACANLANLLLARASARRREISLRLAMGAGRGRVVRQLLTESLVLAFAGGGVAVVVAWWGSQTMFAMVSEGNPATRLELTPDVRTLAFTGAVSFVTALVFGLAPALRATRLDLSSVMKEGGPSVAARGSVGRALVAAQVALSVVLLIGTGLFTRTLFNMKAQGLGYSPDNVILMRVDPITAGYTGDDIGRVCEAVLVRIRALPGVQSATFSENGLFSGTESGSPIRIEGYTPASEADREVRFDQVGPGYFTNVGIPMILGRDFTDADNLAAPRVVVINEKMAHFYFGDRNPIGQLVHYDGLDKFTLTIVGVSADARDHSLREEVQRRMYVPFRQPIDGLTGANYEVRTAIDPAVMARQLRAAVAEIASRMAVTSVKPVLTLIDEALLRERMIAKLSVLFGVVAVVLAIVGLYGVLAYSVIRRTSEIGIRIAVGAMPGKIVWMIVRETLALVAAGVLAGVPVALGLSRYIKSLLFGLTPTDAVTIAGVVGLITTIALVAAIGPARRAARIDPVRALRYE